MNKRSATVHVNKLAAAQRQLRAAIRMYFADEDELAVHTVASAAYRLINDLKLAKGKDEVADYHLTSIFYAVRDFHRGKLPSYMTGNAELMLWIKNLADTLPIEATSKFEDISASVTPDVARQFWNKQNKTSNFLKHADRDITAHIALNEIGNSRLLMQTLGAYTDLVKDDLGAEGLVFWLYSSAEAGNYEGLPENFRGVAERLVELDSVRRREFCSAMILELNTIGQQP
jgi:hypothetical protein